MNIPREHDGEEPTAKQIRIMHELGKHPELLEEKPVSPVFAIAKEIGTSVGNVRRVLGSPNALNVGNANTTKRRILARGKEYRAYLHEVERLQMLRDSIAKTCGVSLQYLLALIGIERDRKRGAVLREKQALEEAQLVKRDYLDGVTPESLGAVSDFPGWTIVFSKLKLLTEYWRIHALSLGDTYARSYCDGLAELAERAIRRSEMDHDHGFARKTSDVIRDNRVIPAVEKGVQISVNLNRVEEPAATEPKSCGGMGSAQLTRRQFD